MIINQDTIESLAKRISALSPVDVKPIQQDIESIIRNLLQSALSRMNLVSREEFDVQTAVLHRTREKLEQLSSKITK